jgi:hypothetical protein
VMRMLYETPLKSNDGSILASRESKESLVG